MNFFNNFQPTYQPTYQPTFNNQPPRFNPEQFKQVISQIDENTLNNLIQQARCLGMSNEQIQEGLKYIQSMK